MNSYISGRVWFLAGQNRALPRLLSEKSPDLLQLPFLFILLFRDNYYTYQQKYEAKNCYYYAQGKREFFEKIACQGNCHNGFTQVRYHFTNKFSACFADDYHQKNFNIEDEICQGENYKMNQQDSLI